MSDALRKKLAGFVSPDTLSPEGVVPGWPSDLTRIPVFLQPASEEEVARIMEMACAEGWRVLPSGAGSWLRGGGTPEVDLVLSTRRLTEMAIYEPADLTFTAGAGVSMAHLAELTSANGQWLPLDPPGVAQGTLGGLAATGGAGSLRHAYGSPRDHILGLTLVSGDGRILRWGGRVVKNVAGFDVTRLCIGSFGALGVITSVSARLFPVPEEERSILLTGSSAEALLPTARELTLSNLPLSGLELVEPLGSLLAEKEAEAGLAIRLMGSRAQVEEIESSVRKLLAKPAGVEDELRVLIGGESRGLFHEMSSWEEGAVTVLRLSLLPSRTNETLEEARTLLSSMGAEGDARMSLHVGWGLLRIALGTLPAGEEAKARIADTLAACRRGLEERGGSLVLSEGPTDLFRRLGPHGATGPERALLTGLKKEFDPRGILAPGRMPG